MSYWSIIVPEAGTNKVWNPSAEEDEVTGGELLSNTGFETAGGGGVDIFASWTENAGDGTITDSATAHGGTHACQFTAGALANTFVYQDVTVTGDRVYQFACYTRGSAVDSGRYRIYDVTNAADIIAITTTDVTAAAYTLVEVAFIAPATCVSVRVYLYCSQTNGDNVYFDDITVKQANAGPIQHGTTVSRSTTYSCLGTYSFRVQCDADNEGILFQVDAMNDAAYYVSMRVYGTLPAAWDWSLDNSTYHAPTKLADLEDSWDLYGYAFVATEATNSPALYVRQNGAGSGDFYLDGIQVEQNNVSAAYRTTYMDGTRGGCEWTAERHNSPTNRSAQSRAGGRVRDLEDIYSLYVEECIGIGVPGLGINERGYALLPGAEYDRTKVYPRTFTLMGRLKGTSRANLHSVREAFWNVIKPDAVPNEQPFLLQYSGTGSTVEVSCRYVDGMRFGKLDGHTELIPLQLHAEDPFWRIPEQEFKTVLDTNDSATVRTIAGRINEDWSAMGPPDVAGTYDCVYAICHASDNTIYIGGDFLNWDNIAAADYIVKYKDGVYSALQSGLSTVVLAIHEGPDGTIYVGGQFLNAGGSGANYITSYNPDTDTFGLTATTQPSAQVNSITTGLDGTLYIGGNFQNLVDANGDRISSLVVGDADWTSLATGLNNNVSCVTTAPDGDIWICGSFTQDGAAAPLAYVAYWNGTAFTEGANGLDGIGEWMAITPGGRVYIGGHFTHDGDGNALNYVAYTDGVIWSPLGENDCNAACYYVVIGPDDLVYFGGAFTQFDGMTTIDRVAGWNGSSGFQPDINLPGAPLVAVVECGPPDPVVVKNYNLYIGWETTGTAYWSGLATVTNGGTRTLYPRIILERSGGTTARLCSIRNETNGQQLWLNYNLLDGETLTIDLRPRRKKVTSDYFGNRLNAILEGSDFATFGLQPGANSISCFVDTTGSPTITAYMLWDELYWGAD